MVDTLVSNTPRVARSALRAALLTLLVAGAGHALAHRAHVHGVAQLEVAADGPVLQVTVHGPLDNILGFEHAPRTAREKQAYAAMLERLRAGGEWFVPNAEAGCVREAQDVEHDREGNDRHADIELSMHWRCAEPARLTSVGVAVWSLMPRLQRLEATVAVSGAARKLTLRRPGPGAASVLRWGATGP